MQFVWRLLQRYAFDSIHSGPTLLLTLVSLPLQWYDGARSNQEEGMISLVGFASDVVIGELF